MNRAPAHGKSQQGFTLLEVLLAFLVFALSFAITLEILTGAIRNTARAREQTEASLIAQSLMDQVGFDIPLRSGASFEGEEGNYRWRVDVFPYQGGTDNARSIELMGIVGLDLLEVECVVSWGQGERERSQVFSTVKAIRPDTEGQGI
ncbi:MAG TPA: prepilin-type N-terminal cleavage/methylation domain-containing protein [Xanthomonadales bacterium]|nr:prepilin-type N-terminal cleavage/methylation domain-containing protein [Xanthomonadales bacterium]